jgi:hypothetical protein
VVSLAGAWNYRRDAEGAEGEREREEKAFQIWNFRFEMEGVEFAEKKIDVIGSPVVGSLLVVLRRRAQQAAPLRLKNSTTAEEIYREI